MIRQSITLFLMIVVTVIATGCDQSHDTELVESPSAATNSPVLATVNGAAITEEDVAFMIERTFSPLEQTLIKGDVNEKVLQSLIASSAMRQTMEKSLPDQQIAIIERKARAYREELFVKAYLQNHATPEPVSTQMVQAYYDDNPEEFGGGSVKTFEMLKTGVNPTALQRDEFLARVETLKTTKVWSGLSMKDGTPLVHKQAKMRKGLLKANLERAVDQLSVNEVSDVIFEDGVPTLLRVVEDKPLSPKPLSSVSTEIRKKLAPLQLKKAVKEASATAIKQSEVVVH